MSGEGTLVGDDRLPAEVARRYRLAAILRPELPGLVDELVRELRRALPEYRDLDQARGATFRRRVAYLAKVFVDLVEYPDLPRDEADRSCRAVGLAEGHAGRALDSLHTAFRVCGRIAWRRIAWVERHRGLSGVEVSWLGDRLFAFLDELSELSMRGYRQARERMNEAVLRHRRKLLQLVTRRPAAAPSEIAALAATVGWTVPDQCAMVALDAVPGRLPPRDLALGADVLADLRGAQPCLLLPGPVTSERLRRLCPSLPGVRLAVGPTVALAEASSSLRWARQALALVADGVLPDVPVTVCADHYTTLWLLGDPGLLRQVARRRLAPLARLPAKQRARLAGTLLAWLRAQGNVQEAAVELSVHPRTVRYRMRQIEAAFGAQLRDPDIRFEIESALRALHLRELPDGE
jgi:PucR-like helix-turn-helix protein